MRQLTDYGKAELFSSFDHMQEAAIAFAVCDESAAILDGLERTLAVEIGFFMATASLIFCDGEMSIFGVGGVAGDLEMVARCFAFYHHAKQSPRKPK